MSFHTAATTAAALMSILSRSIIERIEKMRLRPEAGLIAFIFSSTGLNDSTTPVCAHVAIHAMSAKTKPTGSVISTNWRATWPSVCLSVITGCRLPSTSSARSSKARHRSPKKVAVIDSSRQPDSSTTAAVRSALLAVSPSLCASSSFLSVGCSVFSSDMVWPPVSAACGHGADRHGNAADCGGGRRRACARARSRECRPEVACALRGGFGRRRSFSLPGHGCMGAGVYGSTQRGPASGDAGP